MRGFLIASLAFACTSLAAAEPVELTVALPKGKSWKVEQTVTLACEAPPKKKTAGGAVLSVGTQEPYSLVEKYTDVGVKDEDGRPLELRRTWTSSKLAPNKKPAGATLLENVAALLTATDTGCTSRVEKGKPDPASLDLVGRGRIVPELALLPKELVEAGATWEIPFLPVTGLQQSAAAGVASAKPPARAEIPEVIKRLTSKEEAVPGIPDELRKAGVMPGMPNPTAGSIIVTAKLESLESGVAKIVYSGSMDTHHLPIPPPPNVPRLVTTVTGTLTLAVADRRPVRLEWHVKNVASSKDVGDGTGDAVVPGYTEAWSVVRTYAAK